MHAWYGIQNMRKSVKNGQRVCSARTKLSHSQRGAVCTITLLEGVQDKEQEVEVVDRSACQCPRFPVEPTSSRKIQRYKMCCVY